VANPFKSIKARTPSQAFTRLDAAKAAAVDGIASAVTMTCHQLNDLATVLENVAGLDRLPTADERDQLRLGAEYARRMSSEVRRVITHARETFGLEVTR
jgi:hypothetical protein